MSRYDNETIDTDSHLLNIDEENFQQYLMIWQTFKGRLTVLNNMSQIVTSSKLYRIISLMSH